MPIRKTPEHFAAQRRTLRRRRFTPAVVVLAAATVTWAGVTVDVGRWLPEPTVDEVSMRLPEPAEVVAAPAPAPAVPDGADDLAPVQGPAADAPLLHRRWWVLERQPGTMTVQVAPGPVQVAVAGPGAGQVEVRVGGVPVVPPATVDVAGRSVTVEVRRRAGVEVPVEVWLDVLAERPS
jgi:hypothetical protein